MRRVIHHAHHLDVLEMGDVAEISRAGANQRPLAQLRAGRADHGDRVGRRFDRYAAEPEANRRCSRGNPRRDLLVGIRRQLHRQRADKRPSGRPPIPFRPFGSQSGKVHLVVGLDLQRSAFCDPPRRGAGCLRQAQFTALRVLALLRPAPNQPVVHRHCRAAQRRRQERQELAVGPHRKEMQRGQRNVVILRDVGSGLLEDQAGE